MEVSAMPSPFDFSFPESLTQSYLLKLMQAVLTVRALAVDPTEEHYVSFIYTRDTEVEK